MPTTMPSDDTPLTLTLPEDVPNAFLTFCRIPPRDVPSPESLRAIIRDWITQNANAPLHDIMLPFLNLGLVKIQVSEAARMPREMITSLEENETLGADALAQIRQATHCLIVRSSDSLIFPRIGLWTCLAGGLACAQRFGGVIVDADTQRVFPTDAVFSTLHHQGLLHINNFLLVPMSQAGRGLFWMTTRGMARFGLPEVQVRDIPLIDLERLVWVVCGICQACAGQVMRASQEAGGVQKTLTLPPEMRLNWADVQLERGLPPEQPPPPGCAGKAELRLTLEEAPGTGRTFLTARPSREYRGDYGAWLHSLVHAFFPAEDSLNRAPLDTDAMEQAHRQALATLPQARERFASSALGASRLGLKYGFPTPDGGHEFKWVFVTSWREGHIEGELTNTPQKRTDLRSGQTVTIPPDGIYDWMIVHPEGQPEGGFTDALLTRPGTSAPAEPDSAARRQAIEAELKRRYRQYVESLAQARGTRSGGWVPWPIALGKALLGVKPAPKRNPVQDGLAEHGRFVIAFVVMANTAMLAPGESDAPCLALFVFDEQPSDTDFLIGLVDRLNELKRTTPTDPALREAAILVNDEAYVPTRRRRIPPALTGGRIVYAVDLMLQRTRLAGGYLQQPLMPCLAWPGDTGPIEIVPWTLMEGLFDGPAQSSGN